MEKLTNKQKAMILRDAVLELFHSGEIFPPSSYGLCSALRSSMSAFGLYRSGLEDILSEFPQVLRYEPPVYADYWWPKDDKGMSDRVLILLKVADYYDLLATKQKGKR